MLCQEISELDLEDFKKIVIAWSKLAAIGARPIAEVVGIEREFYARVLNNRRDLPETDAIALGRAMSLNETGFEPFRMQSNLCRQLDDLQAIENLGFRARFVAQILTHKEARGGSSLQKYVVMYFIKSGVGRISIVRMATEKWNRLNAIGRVCGLPTLHIDTAVISLLNNINESVPEKEFVEFEKLLEQPNSEGSLDWLQGKLDNVVANQDSYVNKINIIKRVQRNTLLSRIVEKHTSLVYWPDAAKEYAKSHVLSPLVLEFAPVMALGLLENGKKVFVYMRVINDDEAFVVDQRLKNNIDHYLIFLAHPLNKQKMEIIFDGPAKKLTWEKFQNENSENKKKNEFSAIEICLLNKDVDSEEKIKRRTDDAEKKPVVLDF
jgi:hypothetical protein